MNWEQVEKKAREFSLKFCEDFDISGPTLRVMALEKRIIDFALAMMEKQRDEDSETAMDHDCQTWAECCNCRGDIATAIREGK